MAGAAIPLAVHRWSLLGPCLGIIAMILWLILLLYPFVRISQMCGSQIYQGSMLHFRMNFIWDTVPPLTTSVIVFLAISWLLIVLLRLWYPRREGSTMLDTVLYIDPDTQRIQIEHRDREKERKEKELGRKGLIGHVVKKRKEGKDGSDADNDAGDSNEDDDDGKDDAEDDDEGEERLQIGDADFDNPHTSYGAVQQVSSAGGQQSSSAASAASGLTAGTSALTTSNLTSATTGGNLTGPLPSLATTAGSTQSDIGRAQSTAGAGSPRGGLWSGAGQNLDQFGKEVKPKMLSFLADSQKDTPAFRCAASRWKRSVHLVVKRDDQPNKMQQRMKMLTNRNVSHKENQSSATRGPLGHGSRATPTPVSLAGFLTNRKNKSHLAVSRLSQQDLNQQASIRFSQQTSHQTSSKESVKDPFSPTHMFKTVSTPLGQQSSEHNSSGSGSKDGLLASWPLTNTASSSAGPHGERRLRGWGKIQSAYDTNQKMKVNNENKSFLSSFTVVDVSGNARTLKTYGGGFGSGPNKGSSSTGGSPMGGLSPKGAGIPTAVTTPPDGNSQHLTSPDPPMVQGYGSATSAESQACYQSVGSAQNSDVSAIGSATGVGINGSATGADASNGPDASNGDENRTPSGNNYARTTSGLSKQHPSFAPQQFGLTGNLEVNMRMRIPDDIFLHLNSLDNLWQDEIINPEVIQRFTSLEICTMLDCISVIPLSRKLEPVPLKKAGDDSAGRQSLGAAKAEVTSKGNLHLTKAVVMDAEGKSEVVETHGYPTTYSNVPCRKRCHLAPYLRRDLHFKRDYLSNVIDRCIEKNGLSILQSCVITCMIVLMISTIALEAVPEVTTNKVVHYSIAYAVVGGITVTLSVVYVGLHHFQLTVETLIVMDARASYRVLRLKIVRLLNSCLEERKAMEAQELEKLKELKMMGKRTRAMERKRRAELEAQGYTEGEIDYQIARFGIKVPQLMGNPANAHEPVLQEGPTHGMRGSAEGSQSMKSPGDESAKHDGTWEERITIVPEGVESGITLLPTATSSALGSPASVPSGPPASSPKKFTLQADVLLPETTAGIPGRGSLTFVSKINDITTSILGPVVGLDKSVQQKIDKHMENREMNLDNALTTDKKEDNVDTNSDSRTPVSVPSMGERIRELTDEATSTPASLPFHSPMMPRGKLPEADCEHLEISKTGDRHMSGKQHLERPVLLDFGDRRPQNQVRRIERMANRKAPTTNPNVLEIPDEPEELSIPLLEDIISDVVLENHMRREGIVVHSKRSSPQALVLALVTGSVSFACMLGFGIYFMYKEVTAEDVVLSDSVLAEVKSFKGERFSCVKHFFKAIRTDYAWSQWLAATFTAIYIGIIVPLAWTGRVDIDRNRYVKHKKD